jgi:hypothetical protein
MCMHIYAYAYLPDLDWTIIMLVRAFIFSKPLLAYMCVQGMSKDIEKYVHRLHLQTLDVCIMQNPATTIPCLLLSMDFQFFLDIRSNRQNSLSPPSSWLKRIDLSFGAGLPDFSWYMIPNTEKMHLMNTKCHKWT